VERNEEGEHLRKATSKNVVNVARHYYHQPVMVRGYNDIRNGIRRGLDITRAGAKMARRRRFCMLLQYQNADQRSQSSLVRLRNAFLSPVLATDSAEANWQAFTIPKHGS